MVVAGLLAAFVIANLCWCLLWLQYRAAYRDSVKAEQLALARARRAERERAEAHELKALAYDGWNNALDANLRLIKRDVVTRVRARSEEVRH
jgi:hypothetical protein